MADDTPKFSKKWFELPEDADAEVKIVSGFFEPETNWISMKDLEVTAKSPSFKYMTYAEYYASVQQAEAPSLKSSVACKMPNCPLCSYFKDDADTLPVVPLINAIPGLKERAACPCGCGDPNKEIWNLVIHLNDSARWTREQIADWLDTLDADLRFSLPETPEITEGTG